MDTVAGAAVLVEVGTPNCAPCADARPPAEGFKPPARVRRRTHGSRRRGRRGGGVQAEISASEITRVRTHLVSICCTDAWVDAVIAGLQAKRADGRRLVPYHTDEHGRLRTSIPNLLILVADAGLYPPPATDVPLHAKVRVRQADGSVRREWREYHRGSSMQPCGCQATHRPDPDNPKQPIFVAGCTHEHGDETRSVLWPAHYVSRGRSYTCHVNAQPVDEDLLEAMGVELRTGDGRRPLPPGVAPVVYDDRRWRATKLRFVGIVSDEVRGAIARHRYETFVGNRKDPVTRGLATLGHVVDFLALGHSLAEVSGVTVGVAMDVEEAVRWYPRDLLPRVARPPKWRRVHRARERPEAGA